VKKKNNYHNQVLHLAFLWVPVLIQMALIFYFSAQPAGSPALERFPTPPGIGHLGGYGLLALLLYRAFNESLFSWDFKAVGNTLLVGVLYAISDEAHQMFVPGRNPALFDVAIDTAGIILALLVIRLLITPWTNG